MARAARPVAISCYSEDIMGISGISLGQLLLVFLIAVLLFGSQKLRQLGGDLGAALKGFREGLKEGADSKNPEEKS